MSEKTAYRGARIFDAYKTHDDAALLIADGQVHAIVPVSDIPPGWTQLKLDGGVIVPGFIDLQVNGGGGLMLNNDPSVETIRSICDAHALSGTTAIMPTLITDTPKVTRLAIDAACKAYDQKIPGMIGLHLEGPHLAKTRHGAHSRDLVRSMDEEDCRELEILAEQLPSVMVTLAPEAVTNEQINRLTTAGIIVSLGHSDCTFAQAIDAVAHGASCVTHLFNAMSQLNNREPGLVGAALETANLSAGLIADGYHVDPVNIGLALRAQTRMGQIFLVSDAMAPANTDLSEFQLNGRRILRRDGRLTLEDGTLAGSDIVLLQAINVMQKAIGLEFEEAVRMATIYPAKAINRDAQFGHLQSGARADFVWLKRHHQIGQVWRQGMPISTNQR